MFCSRSQIQVSDVRPNCNWKCDYFIIYARCNHIKVIWNEKQMKNARKREALPKIWFLVPFCCCQGNQLHVCARVSVNSLCIAAIRSHNERKDYSICSFCLSHTDAHENEDEIKSQLSVQTQKTSGLKAFFPGHSSSSSTFWVIYSLFGKQVMMKQFFNCMWKAIKLTCASNNL